MNLKIWTRMETRKLLRRRLIRLLLLPLRVSISLILLPLMMLYVVARSVLRIFGICVRRLKRKREHAAEQREKQKIRTSSEIDAYIAARCRESRILRTCSEDELRKFYRNGWL